MSIGRWFLRLRVLLFRVLMGFGMKIHHKGEPKAPQPVFRVVIPSRLATRTGRIELVFYVPVGYFQVPIDHRYPVVVNFHGGGFALGTATDDAKWASMVVKNVDAVFVSVEYRLAPEFPFSTAGEDGCDAIIFLAAHAEELRLDSNRIGICGFSAGGNLAMTIPLMLHNLKNNTGKRHLKCSVQQSDSTTNTSKLVLSPAKSVYKSDDFKMTDLEISQTFPVFTIKCLVSFYPPLDFRQPRAEKRLTNRKPEKNLPAFLTNLFDASYLYPRDKVDDNDPYLSPVAAPNELLNAAYPDDIILYTCEYDMLNAEGVAFGNRLTSEIGKNVTGGVIKDVAHAFDKMPKPSQENLKATENCYKKACEELTKVFAVKTALNEQKRESDEQMNGVTDDNDLNSVSVSSLKQ
ncbi:tuliposide B-converting enzyme 1, amyloplastic-like [Bradysia coprophila]|uniref:tuliposide B-converting enzyme 1, amyloplastic-like n=1 Tax=Bradysia coprophila TaxID=38358 RepID=UPI00187DB9EA|nr:tuliposide B-converting enzyme 1, amyloplastic-like [Bradysia coprophila]